MSGNRKFFISGLSSYVIWGFIPIFLKELKAHDDIEIIFYRLLVAALIMVGVLLVNSGETISGFRTLHAKSKSDFWIMASLTTIGGGLLAANWVTYIYVVNHVSIHAAAFGYLILPIVTALLALVVLGEKLNFAKWIAVGLSAVSCYMMSHVESKDTLYIISIALTYSFYLISQRRNTYLPRRVSVGIQMVVGTLLMLSLNPIQHSPSELGGHFWLMILIISGIFTVTPLLLNLYALNGMNSSQLAYLIYINPIIGFFSGILWYGESIERWALVAYGLLAVAIIIFNWEWIEKLLVKFPRVQKT